MKADFDKLFPQDAMTKRERVLATLNHQPVDRAAILEQLSYNPRVIAHYTGKHIEGFDYTRDDVCEVIRKTTDLIMPPGAPAGTGQVTSDDGFVFQLDNWTRWRVSRPFDDVEGARDWLLQDTKRMRAEQFDPDKARAEYRHWLGNIQADIGDTVILDITTTSFCGTFDAMGLELFTFFVMDYPDVFEENLELSSRRTARRAHAVADTAVTPVVLLAEDFATKQGPIFPPAFLQRYLYPHVRRVTEAWQEHGLKVLYHSDGNYKKAIPDLIAAGVDGFYCLEPSCGMDIVELKNTWPEMVWAGGVDGVDLMERGTPAAVRAEVHRHIRETNALETGGMFVATSSEINPPIPPENYAAMVDAVGELHNPKF